MTGYQSKKAAARDKRAQPAQEPAAWMYDWFCDGKLITGWIAHSEPEIPKSMALNIRPLYTAPPQRTWVDLMDAEKDGKRVLKNGLLFNAAEVQAWELGVEYAEAKLKDKNNG